MCLWKVNQYSCGHECGRPFLYDSDRCDIARNKPRLSDGARRNCPTRYTDVKTADVITSCCNKGCSLATMIVDLRKGGRSDITFEQARNILNTFKSNPEHYPRNSDARRIFGYYKDCTDFKTADAIESFDALDLNRDSERQRGTGASTGTPHIQESSKANQLAPPVASESLNTTRRSSAKKKARGGGASRGGIGKARR